MLQDLAGGGFVFAAVAIPNFKISNLQTNAFHNGVTGAFAAIPFAIWFFLAIEGVANVAEETINPQSSVLIGFGSAILTLVVLCILTFLSAVGDPGRPALQGTISRTCEDWPLGLLGRYRVHLIHLI